MYNLNQYGYSHDPKTGVWLRADYKGIAYSDGDQSEKELAKIIQEAQDVSVLSNELPQHCTDWAKLYHLSAARGNILRPFEHLLKGKVLEIGAGCGAISRYIGECGAELLSLEGSPRRAAIAASRTRGLDNVTVLAERFDDFRTDELFDAVTLIGVLEYASIFSDNEDPAHAMLARIRKLLKPNGKLFIAIENKLGLKYFAGALEDHLNIAMYGIENRYRQGEPRTFSKLELEQLIARSGFSSSETLSPCPDYKLPNSIVTESGFSTERFDAAALVLQNVKRDPQLPQTTNFNLEHAWPNVISNDLGMQLANSFLVVASCENKKALPNEILGYHYSTGRKSKFCKESIFLKSAVGIQVHTKSIDNNFSKKSPDPEKSVDFHYSLPRVDKYIYGSTLSNSFLEIASSPNWAVSSFTPFIKMYLACLELLLSEEIPNTKLESVDFRLPKNYIDAVPQNIIIDATQTPKLIDSEWTLTEEFDLGLLLVRALLSLIETASPFNLSEISISRRNLIIGILDSASLKISDEQIENYIKLEQLFQKRVTGYAADHFVELDKEIPKVNTPLIHSKIYLSDKLGIFSETNTIRAPAKNGQQVITFDLDCRPQDCNLIRFDPTNIKQSFTISSITITANSGLIWEWNNTHDILTDTSNIALIKSSTDQMLGISSSDDPFITLPVDCNTFKSSENVKLTVDFTLLSDEQTDLEVALIIKKNETFKAALSSLNKELTYTKQTIVNKTNEANLLLQELNKTRQSALQKETEIRDLNLQLDNAQYLAAKHTLEKDLSANNISELELELSKKVAEISTLMHQLDSSSVLIESLSTKTESLEHTLVGIHKSTSWLLTKPIRWIGRIIRGEYKLAATPVKIIYQHMARPKDITATNQNINAGETIERSKPIAVILPIYRDVDMTERCIRKAMPGIMSIPGSIIYAINDCSPDQHMQAMLEALAKEYGTVLFIDKNDTNLGFVGTVNRGLEKFSDYDIVLLNSDVMVPVNWLNRLSIEAYKQHNIGTVTPLSNNATVCSFPLTLVENDQAFGLDVDTIDRVFSKSELPAVECPTGIGFCMYIRRDCLDQIGYLNTERFGRGYGEENDLCQRAAAAGWLNLLTPNLYAYHEGAVSFSSDKIALIERAMNTLNEMHPNYHADVHSFITHDPLKSSRLIRYAQLLASLPIPKVLHVAHRHGGGVIQHIDELVTHYGNDTANLLLTPVAGNNVQLQLRTETSADAVVFNLPEDYDNLVNLLRSTGVSAVHFHHTMEMNRQIISIPTALNVPHLVTVHDFYWINGNPTLTNEDGIFNESESEYAVNTLYRLPSSYTPATWRDSWRPLIETAQVVIFPSFSTKQYFYSKFDIKEYVIAPHVEPGRDIGREPTSKTLNKIVTIGVIGAIGKEKGADLLEALAIEAQNLNLDIKFKLIGYAYRELQGVETTGKYVSTMLPSLIKQHDIDILFFPARWPETFSYTLSYGLDSKLPIFAPNVGAFPERLSGRSFTELFDYNQDASAILQAIQNFIKNIRIGIPTFAKLFNGETTALQFYNENYLELVTNRKQEPTSANSNDMREVIHASVARTVSLRQAALLTVCRINASPRLTFLRDFFPISIRRKVRRLLEGPIHK